MPNKETGDSGNVAEVVRVDDLLPILQKYIDEYNADRPHGTTAQVEQVFVAADIDVGTRHNQNKVQPFYGAMHWLAFQTGMSHRSLFRIMHESTHVSLRTADQILTGLGENWRLSTGEIPVIPNPKWDLERWQYYMDKKGCRR